MQVSSRCALLHCVIRDWNLCTTTEFESRQRTEFSPFWLTRHSRLLISSGRSITNLLIINWSTSRCECIDYYSASFVSAITARALIWFCLSEEIDDGRGVFGWNLWLDVDVRNKMWNEFMRVLREVPTITRRFEASNLAMAGAQECTCCGSHPLPQGFLAINPNLPH